MLECLQGCTMCSWIQLEAVTNSWSEHSWFSLLSKIMGSMLQEEIGTLPLTVSTAFYVKIHRGHLKLHKCMIHSIWGNVGFFYSLKPSFYSTLSKRFIHLLSGLCYWYPKENLHGSSHPLPLSFVQNSSLIDYCIST